jgi:putative ABC transport system ATP-binding protein
MDNAIIKIEELRREFVMGEMVVKALKGISFEISQGEFVTIMGASGSGKSTLLNILGCLDQATHGSYQIDGQLVKDLSRNQLADIRNKKMDLFSRLIICCPEHRL